MRGLILIAVVGMLAGCATVEDTVDIKYIPTTAVEVPNAEPVVLSVVDGRTTDRTRISTKLNGYGMEMAAIRSSREVSEIVREAAVKEFEERGFRVITSGLTVTLTVSRLYNQYSTGFFAGTADGEAELAVSVSDKSGAKLYDHTYKGISKMSVQLANGSNAAESVANALKDAITNMFGDPGFLGVLTKPAPGSAPTS